MAKLVMDSGVCIKYKTIPDVGQSILYSDTIADKLIQQDQVIAARVADVERLQKRVKELEQELQGFATVKDSLTVQVDECEVVRPDEHGYYRLNGNPYSHGTLPARTDFVAWLWDCGPHGERQASCQLWWDDVGVYSFRPSNAIRGVVNTASRVGAVMRRAK